MAELNSGHPQAALDLIDELLADLLARRDTVAERANRRPDRLHPTGAG